MFLYELVRMSDSREWSTDSALLPDHLDLLAWASSQAGKELHLSRGNYRFDYQLTQINLEDERAKRWVYCLSSFKPKAIATIRKVGEHVRVELVFVETNALLASNLVRDDSEARVFLGDQLEKYMIPAFETYVENLSHL